MATAAQVEAGGLKSYFETHRTLETYPTGWYRWWMVLLAVFATIVAFYEFGLSSMLPLWMPSLHFTPGNSVGFSPVPFSTCPCCCASRTSHLNCD